MGVDMLDPKLLRCALPVALLMLAACTSSQGEYPSLAIRPAERIDPAAEAPAPSPPAPIPAELLARAERLKAEAEQAAAGFRRLAPAATSAAQAARGAAVASDRWADAQVAISRLDSQRSMTAGPLGELDLLYAERAVALSSRDEIGQLRQDVANLLAEQDAVLVRLKAMLEP